MATSWMRNKKEVQALSSPSPYITDEEIEPQGRKMAAAKPHDELVV